MGRSPYLRTWYKLPTLTASDCKPSPLRHPLLPGSESLPRDIPNESGRLRNPYLSRGRQMGARKKSSGSIQSVAVDDVKAAKGADSATEKQSGEPSRLYLRRWYPAQFNSAVDMINETCCSAFSKTADRSAVPFER